MAVKDPSAKSGVRLVIEDYPYAADGLLLWEAIEDLVKSYVKHFYSDPKLIKSDVELQAWWGEIKNMGHYDKRDEPWWPKLETLEDLTSILTTMIWITTGHHAAIHFGQHATGGYLPNRPTLMRKLIPQENEPEFEKLVENPQHYFLSCFASELQATKVMAVQESASNHSPDEQYLGQVPQQHNHWINDDEVVNLFSNFSDRLEEIEEIIKSRNEDHKLRNRSGAGVLPYELLMPSSTPTTSGHAIPNSIST